MEIIKELNLNGNPQIAKNGSLVYAENIRLSLDGTFLTNDEGFENAIIISYGSPAVLPILKVKNVTVPNPPVSISGNIVGNINCPNEIVVFTNSGKIYRLVECTNYNKLCVIDTNITFTYSSGKINGTYIYNVEGDLIIALGEYDGQENVPLKVINLNKDSSFSDESFFTTAPNVPLANLYFKGYVNGNIPSGVYYYFVRYKHDNIYTKWFPIGKPYQAVNTDFKRLVYHTYNIGEISNNEVIITDVHVNINKENNCKDTFSFNLLLEEGWSKYDHVQIGYIIQSNNAIVARINEEFELVDDNNTTKNIEFIFNTTNSKEVSIDEIIKPVFKINNVKALTNFNNKLYIGNYDEIDNDDNENNSILAFLSNNPITPIIDKKSVSYNTPTVVTNIPIQLRLQNYDDTNKTVEGRTNIELTINVNSNFEYTLDSTNPDGIKIIDHLLSTGNVNGTSQIGIDKYDSNQQLTTDYEDYRDALNDVKLNFSNEGFVVYIPPADHQLIRYTIAAAADSNYYDLTVTYGLTHMNFRQDLIKGIIVNTIYDGLTNYDLDEEVNSFIPGEQYNFYIHYIRKDGSYTDGFLINTNGPCGCPFETLDNYDLNKYSYKFSDVKNPDANIYKGCFITYTKLKNVYTVYVDKVQGNLIYGKATDYQLALIDPQNCKIKSLYLYNTSEDKASNVTDIEYPVLSMKPVLSNAVTQIGVIKIDRTNIEGVIVIEVELPSGQTILPDLSGYVMSVYENVVTEDNLLQLHSLGYNYNFEEDNNSNIYKEHGNSTLGYISFNTSGYIVYDKSVKYLNHIYTKEDNKVWKPNTVDFDNDDNLFNQRYGSLLKYPKYSNFYLNAISIKKEPEEIESVHDNNRIIHNTIIEAQNLSDLFQLKSDYLINVYKAYLKYDENRTYVDKFTNGIRNSYPIRTESVETNWRIFDSEDYYLIDKQLGEITNLLGVNKYLYIHTNGSLLIASSDATITANNTNISLNQHKLFDVAPTELFTSDLGYGGLKYQDAQIFSINGYIWYDADHNKLFRYDNSKIEDLTSYIQEYVDKYKFEFCYFNLDNKTNRVFISFTNDNLNYYTFGYSTLVDKFISKLNFKFSKNIHTTNNSYFTVGNALLKYSDTDFGNYKSLSTISLSDKIRSIFDIIINIGPEIPKELESIRWIHKYLNSDIIDTNNYAELKEDNILKTLNSLFKNPENVEDNLENVYLRIFNNNVDSGELPLFNGELNSIEPVNTGSQQNIQSYKYPHYEKGVWQFNYFRDGILIDLTETDIDSIIDENEKNRWLKLAQTFEEKIIDGVKHYYRLSNVQSLIYGTYFVIRFIFENKKSVIDGTDVYFNKRFKFDSISIKINNY